MTQHPPHRTTLALLLAGLSTLGPFSIDTYMPSFPAIQASLQATPLQLQQTLSVYLLCFAIMMLFHGSLSDSLGRRPIILGSLIAFILTSFACVFAQDIHTLIMLRGLQGLSAGAGMIVGRAIIRDLYAGAEAQPAHVQNHHDVRDFTCHCAHYWRMAAYLVWLAFHLCVYGITRLTVTGVQLLLLT